MERLLVEKYELDSELQMQENTEYFYSQISLLVLG